MFLHYFFNVNNKKDVEILPFFLINFLVVNSTYAQKEASKWFFGNNAGLDFLTSPPTSIPGASASRVACASICDSLGNLLFYTNGIEVWDRTNQVMQNGTGLMGNEFSVQVAMILKHPGKNYIYYVFTSEDDDYFPFPPPVENGINYSIVDMRLNNGYGAITKKNVNLVRPSMLMVAAVKQCKRKAYWVICPKFNSDEIYTFNLDKNGLDTVPVVSKTGILRNGKPSNMHGDLKASPDGDMIGMTIRNFQKENDPRVVLFDFDRASGSLHYKFGLTGFHDSFESDLIPVAIEFSNNNRYFYVGTTNGLYQYDLEAGDSNSVLASKEILIPPQNDTDLVIGDLRRAPDGKIYFTRFHEYYSTLPFLSGKYLSAIPNPDRKYPACGLELKAAHLKYGKYRFGLPNINPSLYENEVSIDKTCPPGRVNFKLNLCSYDSILWQFDDGFSKMTLTDTFSRFYKESGQYKLKAIVYSISYIDTFNRTFQLNPVPQVNFPEDQNICPKDSVEISLNLEDGEMARWFLKDSLISTSTSLYLNKLGSYKVRVDNDACGVLDSFRLDTFSTSRPVISSSFYCHEEPAYVSLANDPFVLSHATIFWSNGDSSISTQYVAKEDSSYVTITDSHGCSNTTFFRFSELCPPKLFVPNAFTPNGDFVNDSFQLKGEFINEFNLKIYNRWGEKLFETNKIEDHWDGTFKDKIVPEGIYFYQVIYNGFNPYVHRKYLNGTFHLLR